MTYHVKKDIIVRRTSCVEIGNNLIKEFRTSNNGK